MPKRNLTTYRGRFSGIRMHAFGIPQTLDFVADIEIYQARVSPELWRARPKFEKGDHKWEACSAEALMCIIESDFVHHLKPFRIWRTPDVGVDPTTPPHVQRIDQRRRA